ncbi:MULTISPECIES: DUF4491 family protein [Clostridium]|uniref:Probable membrane protein n=1 Tax=Clostridium novyi (strain NT) TaxID=386415 RepID=A0Q2R6_CLONN|nr:MULTISPECIES: DUF4491 family protein [Clostridium]ABK60411.1 probable membrane protein [Clostridium novyi NT]KEH85777.1 membrane protein [Clostridium novyi A str. NCTC 538]KEH89723.1 membrane protein [Clostridium novyi A str. 4540]KEH90858.1 membrane protein [Clostridium novyi A str. BKT29909]KEH92653.1 membrane protein [Clostridium novyi A str. GD211209]
MNIQGVLIGLSAFLIIGAFHPIVIKGEYYFGKGIWPIFLVVGIVFLTASIVTKNQMGSAILGVIGFSCLWSIIEIFEQETRVKKGWFPKNPKRLNKKTGRH